MAFKTAFIAMADGDPKRHRAFIKTAKLELTTVIVNSANFGQIIEVCEDLVKKDGIQSLTLCPGFSHEAVAQVKNAVGQGVAVNIARGDTPSTRIVDDILAEEGWF